MDDASISGIARARSPRIETVSPGRTANTICPVRCGGSFTSVPSVRIKPSTSPRGVSVYCLIVPRVSGSCEESHTAPWARAVGLAVIAVVVRSAPMSTRVHGVFMGYLLRIDDQSLTPGTQQSACQQRGRGL